MKPCGRNRKPIAWLAVGALEPPATRELRAHLAVCEGCRAYLQEISDVAQALNATAITPDIDGPESFHRRVAGALRLETPPFAWQRAAALLRGGLLNWRVALPALAVLVLGTATFSHFQRHATALAPRPAIAAVVPTANTPSELEPSIGNYQIATRGSPDQLDELLTKQANRSPSFAPVYTAWAFARVNGPD